VLLGFAIPMLIATTIGLASLIVALLWVRRRMARNLCRIWYSRMDACEMAWNRFATNRHLIRSLCAVAWAPASPAR
jgi:hypothetical protein